MHMHCREVVDTCARRTLEFGVNAVAPCNATNATIVIAFIIVDGIIRRIVSHGGACNDEIFIQRLSASIAQTDLLESTVVGT